MTTLLDAYGGNYEEEIKQSKIGHVVTNICNNIGNRQFKFKLQDASELWDINEEMVGNVVNNIIMQVNKINKKLFMIHLKKNSEKINMLPELIVDSLVEYFVIIDVQYARAYLIYISPSEVNSY